MDNMEIIDEIRRRREAHAASCGFNIERIIEDTKRTEEELRRTGWVLITKRAAMRTAVHPVGSEEFRRALRGLRQKDDAPKDES